jgi:hypothetical protein
VRDRDRSQQTSGRGRFAHLATPAAHGYDSGMKTITSMMIAALLATSLGGCLVRTTNHSRHHSHARSRDCPPAYHWNGNACVHNGRGKAKGHRK